MIAMFLFVSLGYWVISYGKPFHVAATFAVVNSLMGLFFGGSILSFLIGATLLFVYASAFYYVLDNYGDGIFMSLAILLGGSLGMFFIPMMLAG